MADQTFRLPDLGEGLTEAQLVAWKVEEGGRVDVNTPLCEVETAKAVVVIPSPWAGTIQKLHARPGESVAVGEALVTIAAAEAQAEDTPGTLVGYGPGAPEAGIRRKARTATSVQESGGDVRAAPFVRQLAKEMGVDLAQVQGSGPGGRIVRADVEAAASAPAAAPSTPASSTDGERRISVVGIRKAIARQMVRSVSTIPQFTEFAIFDATSLMKARERRKASGRSMTPLPYFIAAVVKAVHAFPLMNSSWDESRDEIIVKQLVNVGIAVNTSQGLLVPVLRAADQLELTAIAEKSAQLIEGARAGTLPPGQMSGGTITVTNVGASGPVETGTPIINPPECCVVAFGAIKPRPMVVDGKVVARSGAWISISVDHRIVDGALATEFLTALVAELETISA
ncbi:MAG TPA: dihydrolipoamide acetyltransferase family protein [Candidatus Dormibacteraeota bacterium]|jgi:2-oxoisovalerate dehydrogenase E2 component (dihydrolipoyl transacylase)|nr:dihydrolipoamide acetyltransferase family protein [Candidatus Dormibacteraeota bacterium]